MDKRYTVFVSSTYEDLKSHRDAVIRAIMRAGHIPLGMEAFGAANASQWKVITKTIDNADYYVLIIAHRYGSVSKETGLSFTEMEFNYALEMGIPCLVFPIHEDAYWDRKLTDANSDNVSEFKRRAMEDRLVAFWRDEAELKSEVTSALLNAFSDSPRPGWMRSPKNDSFETASEIARLSQENSELRQRISSEHSEINDIINFLKNKHIIVRYRENISHDEDYDEISASAIDVFNKLSSALISGVGEAYIIDYLVQRDDDGPYFIQSSYDAQSTMKSLVDSGLVDVDSSDKPGVKIYKMSQLGRKVLQSIVIRSVKTQIGE
ncbi:DUF4062 domain-containing protein [Deinococcus sp. SDU3-2]|uniref:DUF4062 domain-containing protein n=1 Tax=Deinococcus terrestris TaxID=2651870 RepID=A0A7X1NWU7_9DEIO|nr:DUF4062 domain-containing protein [Deinococcus terrestris]MPY67297.1 DUF4062 domain-containing protein [Deinococcus terrestris]